jgi:Mrp family chromosome partitioning ATPase
MLVADASVLATQVDGVILIVRAGANNAGIVQKTAEQLSRVGAHVLGVVLEGVRTTAGGYLRRNYETFYEYHQKALP